MGKGIMTTEVVSIDGAAAIAAAEASMEEQGVRALRASLRRSALG